MTAVFMSLVAAVISERISVATGLRPLPVLLANRNRERRRVAPQRTARRGGPALLRRHPNLRRGALLLILLFPPRYTRSSDLLVVVGFYALAKILETFDRPIFTFLHVVSGHTLKHLAGALAGYWILRMLQKGKPVPKLARLALANLS